MARNIAERILDMFSKEISGLGSAVRENARTRQLRLQSAKVSGIAVNVLRRKPVFIGPCPCWVQPHIPGQHLRGFREWARGFDLGGVIPARHQEVLRMARWFGKPAYHPMCDFVPSRRAVAYVAVNAFAWPAVGWGYFVGKEKLHGRKTKHFHLGASATNASVRPRCGVRTTLDE